MLVNVKQACPSPKSRPKIKQKRERGVELWAVSKISSAITTTPNPTHPQLSSMKEASNKKTQRVKVMQYDPLYLLSTKKHRWTARGRTRMSPTCSRRTLMTSLSPSPKSQVRTLGCLQNLMGHHPTTPQITFRGSECAYIVQIDDLSTPECQECVPSHSRWRARGRTL